MTSPAVVILTDPASCQLADADGLLKAVLQVQQLSHAGVPTSQAFCDHPAAAQEFVEAYSRSYPELQQQSSDLPLPEELYSMVADGRLGPLLAPAPGDFTEPGEAAQLYPLYVLSLGAPEALKQALQHDALAKSKVRILEIAPTEHPRAETVPVAEAVAHVHTTRSWLAESSSELHQASELALRSEAPRDSDTIKLDGVEVDLDHIRVDEDGGRKADPPFDGSATGSSGLVPPGEPAPARLAALPSSLETHGAAQTEPAGATGPVTAVGSAPPAEQKQLAGAGTSRAEESAGSGPSPSDPPDDRTGDQIPAADGCGGENNPSSSAPDPTEPPIAASGPAAEQDPVETQPSPADPHKDVGSAPTEPAVVTAPAAVATHSEPSAEHGQPPGDGVSTTDGSAGSGQSWSDPPDDRPGDQIVAIDGSGLENGTPSNAMSEPTDEPIAASDQAAEQDPIASRTSSFADPGEDVRYAPTGHFTCGDDLRYPLPAELVPDIHVVEDSLDLPGCADDLPGCADVVDLEALYSDLCASAYTSVLAVEKFDATLPRALQSGAPAGSDYPGSPPILHEASPQCRETPDPAQDDAQDQAPTTVHDTDL